MDTNDAAGEHQPTILKEADVKALLAKHGIDVDQKSLRIFLLDRAQDSIDTLTTEGFLRELQRYSSGQDIAFNVWEMGSEKEVTLIRKCFENYQSSQISRITVFLGGSCNPTTWRKTITIPALEELRISYHNPQVDDWYPELMEIERKSKENAVVLFFAIDNQTRAVVSMLEAAEFIGAGRKLVFSIQEITDGYKIGDSTIVGQELRELNNARLRLGDIAMSNGLEVYPDVKAATDHLREIFDPSVELVFHQQIRPEQIVSPNFLYFMQTLFEKYDRNRRGFLDVRELNLLLNRVGFRSSLLEIKRIFRKVDLDQNDKITFHEFFEFMVEIADLPFKHSKRGKQSSVRPFATDKQLVGTLWKLFSSYYDKQSHSPNYPFVSLGGSFDHDWRERIAIPILQQHRLNYFIPLVEHHYLPFTTIEANAREACKHLLYVLSPNERCFNTLVEAAYYIGKKKSVIIVSDKIPAGTKIGTHTITDGELKDINRGRSYLEECASHASCPVFRDVESAIHHIVKLASANTAN